MPYKEPKTVKHLGPQGLDLEQSPIVDLEKFKKWTKRLSKAKDDLDDEDAKSESTGKQDPEATAPF